MTLLKPLWIQSAVGDADLTWPGAEFRQLVRAIAGGSGNQGVIAPASAVVTHRAAGANFTVDIQPFSGIVYGDDVSDQGSYLVTNTAVYNLTVCSGAPGSGTRTYRIVARVRDKRANAGWSTYDWVPYAWDDPGTGEHSEGPSELTLAHVAVANGQANIQDSHITIAYPRLRSLYPLGPWSSNQSSSGGWNVSGAWTDFTGGQWPAVSFTVPPSGQVFVTMGITLSAQAGANEARCGWRCSGTDTVAADKTKAVVTYGPGSGSAGTYKSGGSRRFRLSGLTPGASNTITPQWWATASGQCNDDNDGQLIIEDVQ